MNSITKLFHQAYHRLAVSYYHKLLRRGGESLGTYDYSVLSNAWVKLNVHADKLRDLGLQPDTRQLQVQVSAAATAIRAADIAISRLQADVKLANSAAVSASQEAARWKASHDNQVKLKRMLMDRPDLGDRAESIQRLMADNESLRQQLSISLLSNISN